MLESHSPFFARSVPQHSLRNRLEGGTQAPELTVAKGPTRPTYPLQVGNWGWGGHGPGAGGKETEAGTGKRDLAQAHVFGFPRCNAGTLGLQAVETEKPKFLSEPLRQLKASHSASWK